MECKSATHYAGCACHEARRDEEIARLREALERCRDKFREYARIHWAKGTYDGDRKARANEAMAVVCDEALNGGKKG